MRPVAAVASLLLVGCSVSGSARDAGTAEPPPCVHIESDDRMRAGLLAEKVFEHFARTGTCPSTYEDVASSTFWRPPAGQHWIFICGDRGAAVASLGEDQVRSFDDFAAAYVAPHEEVGRVEAAGAMMHVRASKLASRCATFLGRTHRCPATAEEMGEAEIGATNPGSTWTFVCSEPATCVAVSLGHDGIPSEDDWLAVGTAAGSIR